MIYFIVNYRSHVTPIFDHIQRYSFIIVCRAPINGGGGFSTGIRHKESQIFAIAVDWIYERIYSTGKKTIESAGFKGEMPKTLIDSNLSSVWSIAVDPLRG